MIMTEPKQVAAHEVPRSHQQKPQRQGRGAPRTQAASHGVEVSYNPAQPEVRHLHRPVLHHKQVACKPLPTPCTSLVCQTVAGQAASCIVKLIIEIPYRLTFANLLLLNRMLASYLA